MEQTAFLVSVAALAVSGFSFYFSIRSWQESNRPIVTARVASVDSGNVTVPLDLVVENTGSRPAKDISLSVDEQALEEALVSVEEDDRVSIKACFSEKFSIPVLANGASVTNYFGALAWGSDGKWKWHSRIPITIRYRDLDGRRFKHSLALFVSDNAGFASSHWGKSRAR